MKKVILITFSLLAFACKKESSEGYQISGKLTGFEENETVYINKISDANRPIIIDSTTISKGKFVLKLPTPESRDFNFLTFSKAKGNILLIAENTPIEITADIKNLRGAKINGGKENDVFSEYLKNIVAQSAVETEIAGLTREATQTGNYEVLKQLKVRKDSIDDAKKSMRLDAISKQPNSIVSLMAISDMTNFKMITSKEAKLFFNKMNADLKESRLGISLNKTLNLLASQSTKIGDTVADFTAPDPIGNKLNLKKNLGKITLLDFWASWCRPCRAENPNVVRVYNKYHSKGLEIIGVSLDRDGNKWKQAIENDGLIWKHVSNLQFWNEPIAKSFGVRSIPATFLLDENGVIIAKNLRGQALENKIAELLN